ncbi:Monooxygenase FAD-binding [Penicillium robsamsonii]|uniref:Monooxygenase FAD-binding n=1 Tax=Penicillium robsamsonii TaxID=1792511 RepID=UPI0025477CBA|nr:Monooxygenase FAD-binding [Penicillium robsamsonii]KAJ5811045.1 Monooxygenase FAD-binding [Penicillium robsamsonii]
MVSNGQANGHISQASLKTPTYPSNCLKFLNDPLAGEGTIPAQVRLNIIVVGAGLGGLATAIALASSGHTVTVYEQAQKLGEVGAGIQIPSNSTRLLSRLGLDPYLKEYVTEPGSISFRRWQSGDVIGLTQLIPNFREQFGAPYYVIHRANFHSALHKRALDLGVTVKVASRVVGYNVEGPSIVLGNGETASADLVVAADGVKSVARGTMDESSKPSFEKTGFAAYRATVDVERIKEDPELAWLLEKPALNIWIGDQRHVMTYTIGAGKSFNMVLSHPDDSDPSTWDQVNTLSDMRREFQGWDSRLEKIIGLIEKTIKWPLISGVPLPRWVNGKVLILGDAAHAMLPYMSQGAAMAVEDGAALARSLSKIGNAADIPKALGIFEQIRIERAGMMQEASLLNGKLWHFADGSLQEARDAAMKPETLGLPSSHSPNQWSDPATQIWCYGYDAEQEIDQAWKSEL